MSVLVLGLKTSQCLTSIVSVLSRHLGACPSVLSQVMVARRRMGLGHLVPDISVSCLDLRHLVSVLIALCL